MESTVVHGHCYNFYWYIEFLIYNAHGHKGRYMFTEKSSSFHIFSNDDSVHTLGVTIIATIQIGVGVCMRPPPRQSHEV